MCIYLYHLQQAKSKGNGPHVVQRELMRSKCLGHAVMASFGHNGNLAFVAASSKDIKGADLMSSLTSFVTQPQVVPLQYSNTVQQCGSHTFCDAMWSIYLCRSKSFSTAKNTNLCSADLK